MPAKKNPRANPEVIDRLIKESGKQLNALVEDSHLKTLQRARKGERLKPASFRYLAQEFGVEISDLVMEEDQPDNYDREVSIRLIRAESIRAFPDNCFYQSDVELLLPLLCPHGLGFPVRMRA